VCSGARDADAGGRFARDAGSARGRVRRVSGCSPEPWKITPQSDRYGFRLEGTPLLPCAPIELRSHGIVPGVIQVPPGGQPIVQMRDAQPSGGYPKIGTIIEADLWRLGQVPIGSLIRFVEVTWEEAVAGQQTNDRWLAGVRRLVGLHRARGGR
jgi:allophanate hydrolase subunit 2